MEESDVEFSCKKRHCRSSKTNCKGDAQECERLRLASLDSCSKSCSTTKSCSASKSSKKCKYTSLAPTKPRSMSGLHTLRTLVRCVWPKNEWSTRLKVLTALLLLLLSKLLNISVPLLLKVAIDKLTSLTEGSSELALESEVAYTSLCVLMAYGAAKAGSAVLGETRNALFAQVAYRSINRIALVVFRHLHDLDLSFHVHRQTGALSKAIDRGSRGIASVLNALVFNVLPTAMELVLVTIVLGLKCGLVYALVALGAVGVYVVFTICVTRWRTKFRLKMNEADNLAGNKAVDSLINFETVKYFNNEEYEAKEYEFFMTKFEKASVQTRSTLSLLNAGQQVIFSAALTLLTALAALSVVQGEMGVGDLVMINGLLLQLSFPLNFLGSVYRDIMLALTDMETMFDLTRTTPQVRNVSGSPDLFVSPSTASVSFDQVSFEYLSGQRILNNISFTVEAGQRVAVVGTSGSGKSTLVRLLFRFFDPVKGTVRINGQDLSKCDLNSVRRKVAIVPQDAVLFHNTIRHNIGYGDLMATDTQIMEAAKLAEMHDAILTWPHGYDTQVGERGLRLSGGEKQRLAIARAVLKNAPVIVFDEATSSLDSKTETDIMKAIEEATKGRTAFIIAHRLSTIVNCDLILVLDKGQVVEMGNYKQLMEQETSVFFSLWQHQHQAALDHQQEIREREWEEQQEQLLLQAGTQRCEKMCCG